MKLKNKIKNYLRASEIFNNENKDYKILIFQDFDFLHLYVHNLIEERYEELIILNNFIMDLSVKELVKQYYLLVDVLFNE